MTTTKYYHDSIQTRLNPAPHYNEEPTSNVSDISLFEGQVAKQVDRSARPFHLPSGRLL